MAGFTNRGKKLVLGWAFRNETIPTNFYVALVTSANAPNADVNTFTTLTEIADGNGYTSGGYQLTPNSTDFDTWSQDDSNDYGVLEIKDIVWTASGGSIPDSGDGARYAVLLDDNATVANRQVIAYWDLTSDRSVSDGQTLTLVNSTLRLTES